MKCFCLAVAAVCVSSVSGQAVKTLPTFADYPAAEVFRGKAAEPILASKEQKRFRTRIRNGVLSGEGVWNGSWKNPQKVSGPNFAGHYFVARWGCGSNCLMMALVDAKTGVVYDPPQEIGSPLHVEMDMLGDGEIDFTPSSSLMIFRNACKSGRRECGVYYFEWKDNRFRLLTRTLMDLTKESR